ncbi:MAG: CocE/NonD family hydrolase [Bacteroidales bacterium]
MMKKLFKILIVIGILAIIIFLVINQLKAQKVETEIVMSDGVRLSTTLFVPKGWGKYPAVLVRSPYNKTAEEWMGQAFNLFRIAVVLQDVRGKYKSGGEYYPFINERKDGLETLRWIRKQSWSNGEVAGWGGSYVGYTQWAISDSLDFMTLLLTGSRLYDFVYPDSLFSLQTAGIWGFDNASNMLNGLNEDSIRHNLFILPVSSADDSTVKDVKYYNDWLAHEKFDSYWKQMDFRGKSNVPVLSIAGWYDLFLKTQIADFQALQAMGNNTGRMIIGPFAHGPIGEPNEYGGLDKTGDPKLIFKYARKIIKGKKAVLSDPLKDAKYNLFVMERNEYVGSETWPPAETSVTPYYIGPHGYLEKSVPSTEGELRYDYDPADPYPSHGGTALGKGVGPARQNANTSRADQLVFKMNIEKEPLVLLGPVSATVWLTSSAKCTDFFVLLQDEFPDGKIINIQEGGAKVKFVNEMPQKTEISVWATGYQLNPGHKLRIVITSSWFPRFNRNLNNCDPLSSAINIIKAKQTVWYGAKTPSSINLPVYKISDKKSK